MKHINYTNKYSYATYQPSSLSSILCGPIKHIREAIIDHFIDLVNYVAILSIPLAWNKVVVPDLHKKGDAMVSNNYCLVFVMCLQPKLYMAYLNNYIMIKSESGEWRAPTQAGFRKRHHH